MSATRPRWATVARRAPFLAWLVGLWVALWGEVSVANVVSGMVAAGTLVALFPRAAPGPAGAFNPLRALQFLGYFIVKLVEANLVVAWEVVTPHNRLNQAIVAVPLRTRSEAVATLVANAISLTPGTLTIEVGRNPLTLYVHVMHLRSIEQTRRDVRALEHRAVRACPAGPVAAEAAAEAAPAAGEPAAGEPAAPEENGREEPGT